MVVEEKELDEQIVEDANPEDTNPEADAAAETDKSEKAQDNTETDDKKEKKKSFLGKEKKDKPNKLQEKVDELEDKVKRQMAEFDNFRKRSEKEKSAMFETGAKSVVEKILPVVDNFERGLAGLSEEELKQPFAEGMNMVYKQLIAELEKLEVKPIEAVGCEFNPELHNAVMQVESEEYATGVIAQELQKGYTYRDSVVRHSMVAVVQ
ncbi:MAG: nucleotide exchange factor GrpE [Lachnospiraceae bacterium]|nr:nucleotide exchange factor GrpE [Lachnospiraceae bacterium]